MSVTSTNNINIMTCIPTAGQRLGKHASLTIEVVFSGWSEQSGYNKVYSSMK
jgi:hypothetical protein